MYMPENEIECKNSRLERIFLWSKNQCSYIKHRPCHKFNYKRQAFETMLRKLGSKLQQQMLSSVDFLMSPARFIISLYIRRKKLMQLYYAYGCTCKASDTREKRVRHLHPIITYLVRN